MPGLLLNLAVSDAYGGAFEFAPPRFVSKYNNVKTYRQHPTHVKLKPGCYTDDTQMEIAFAELLLSGDPLTPLAWANKVMEVFKRDPRVGYARGFQALLEEVKDGTELLSRVLPHSRKNGGAMRAPICGMLNDPDDACDLATWQASLTHGTKEGTEAAQAAALLVWLCRNGEKREDLGHTLEGMLPGHAWHEQWKGPVDTWGTDAVWAALSAIQTRSNMRDILWQCVQFTGDVDTVAAIACAAASQHPDIEQNLPAFLFEKLENGLYGRKYIEDLDEKLTAKYDAPVSPEPVAATEPEDDALGFIDELFSGGR